MASLFNEDLGVEIPVPEAPRRIVGFSPAATEVLFQLGLGDNVVGVSAFCARPPREGGNLAASSCGAWGVWEVSPASGATSKSTWEAR